MTVHFYLRYNTRYGQSILISGNSDALGNNDTADAATMSYLNEEYWYGSFDLPAKPVDYFYILREGDTDIIDGEKDRSIEPGKFNGRDVIIMDSWNDEGSFENCFYTKPFREILLHPPPAPKTKSPSAWTHEFLVKAPLLNENECLCISGSGKQLNNWDIKNPIFLSYENNWYSIRINFGKEDFPLRYKYGIYNTKTRSFTFESGNDRILQPAPIKKQVTVLHDGFVRIPRHWKGAGVAIPVFSLRSKTDLGSGEFNDIKLLVDWAAQAGLKLLQFLPVNDTTATHTAKDSYPYAAISAFALHPLYINLETVAGSKDASVVSSYAKKKKELDRTGHLDYDATMESKLSCLRKIYKSQKKIFLKEINSTAKGNGFREFFEVNREWLIPYAAWCYLRDKHKTADTTEWKTNSIYEQKEVEQLVSPSQPQYEEICFHYWVQYHLHLQLKEASEYAHKKGIILKGDIPIGVSRKSCDVWVDPSLYNLDEQAGAPPDDFAVKGQNWGFPTYNWKAMQLDDYSWWRRRFEQMSTYFDSFRIDHILGFFRIWSIPVSAVEGILGRFVPAIPIHISEFHKSHTWFDYSRYCRPYITDDILESMFGEGAGEIKKLFLDKTTEGRYQLKEEFNTQQKIEKYFEKVKVTGNVKQGLFDLISNIILIEEPGAEHPDKFHFRISMEDTSSFRHLDHDTRQKLSGLYLNYFYNRQDELWKKEAMQKLPALKRSTNMLICGEDLGMVPHCVPEVMEQAGILSLEIQRMPKDPTVDFFHPRTAPYLSVVTPSTHDMSTIREWWEEDKERTQRFYNFIMGHYGKAPDDCSPAISKDIILQHIYSPAMWSIFQVQDLLGISEKLRRKDFLEERINQPSDPEHYWKYRMHLTLEDLVKQKEFNKELRTLMIESGRI
jgi:4-alpha-glucanotransferase